MKECVIWALLPTEQIHCQGPPGRVRSYTYVACSCHTCQYRRCNKSVDRATAQVVHPYRIHIRISKEEEDVITHKLAAGHKSILNSQWDLMHFSGITVPYIPHTAKMTTEENEPQIWVLYLLQQSTFWMYEHISECKTACSILTGDISSVINTPPLCCLADTDNIARSMVWYITCIRLSMHYVIRLQRTRKYPNSQSRQTGRTTYVFI